MDERTEATVKQLALSLSTENNDNCSPDLRRIKEAFLYNVRELFGDIGTSRAPGQGVFSSTGPVPQFPLFLTGLSFNQPATDIFGQPRNTAPTPPHVRLLLNSLLSDTNNNADSDQPQQLDLEEAGASNTGQPEQSKTAHTGKPINHYAEMARLLAVVQDESTDDDWAQGEVAKMSRQERDEVIEMAAFAQKLKEKREILKKARSSAFKSMREKYNFQMSYSTLAKFEKLNLSMKSMRRFRPTLEKWLNDVENGTDCEGATTSSGSTEEATTSELSQQEAGEGSSSQQCCLQ